MVKKTNLVCPNCGHQFGGSSGNLRTVQELWGELSPGLRPLIRKVTDRIKTYCGLPSTADMQALLTIIVATEERTVRYALDRFHDGDHYAKGVRYLRAVVQGIRNQVEQQRKAEREQFGTPPPLREVENGEEKAIPDEGSGDTII